MAVRVNSVVRRVSATLNDPNNKRWTLNDLIGYLSDGQLASVQHRPECNPKTATVVLVEGTKQAIPDDAFELITCVRNIARGANSPIIKVSRYNLDRYNKAWHDSVSATVVRGFVYDRRDRKTYYVFPGVVAGTNIELMYSKIPDEITLVSNDATEIPNATEIELDAVYTPMLMSYMLYRAYEKEIPVEGQSQQSTNIAKMHYDRFMDYILSRERSDMRLDPTHQQDRVKDKGPGY